MISFVHCADLHLGTDFSSFDPLRRNILTKNLNRSFSEVIDYCILNKTDVLLIPGDVFDSPFPSPDTSAFFADELNRLENTLVFIAKGNHDYAADISAKNTHVFSAEGECVYLSELNLKISGRSFASQYEPTSLAEALFADKSLPHLLCIHAALDGKDYNPLSRRTLAEKNFTYCALGHSHEYSQEILSSSTVCYSGCIMGRGFDERGVKGFISGKIYSPSKVDVQFVPVKAPIFDELNVKCPDEDSLYRLKESLSPSGLYKINVSESPFPRETIEKILGENSFYCKVTKIDADENIFTRLLKQELKNYPLALEYALSALEARSLEI